MIRKKERGNGNGNRFYGKKLYSVLALGNVHGNLDASIFTEYTTTVFSINFKLIFIN